MENMAEHHKHLRTASVCYEAERVYNRAKGRKDQLPWADLPETHKDDTASQVKTIRENISVAEQLGTGRQLWAAIIKVLMPV